MTIDASQLISSFHPKQMTKGGKRQANVLQVALCGILIGALVRAMIIIFLLKVFRDFCLSYQSASLDFSRRINGVSFQTSPTQCLVRHLLGGFSLAVVVLLLFFFYCCCFVVVLLLFCCFVVLLSFFIIVVVVVVGFCVSFFIIVLFIDFFQENLSCLSSTISQTITFLML